MTFPQNSTEKYYQKFIELQEKLRKSEEERIKLEMKFNEMIQVTREEEQLFYKKLRNQYKQFLEENRLRQERNERILRFMERIESRAAVLEAKTQRVQLLRQQYQNYFNRIGTRPKQPIDTMKLQHANDDVLPKYDGCTCKKFPSTIADDILATIYTKQHTYPERKLNVDYNENTLQSLDDSNASSRASSICLENAQNADLLNDVEVLEAHPNNGEINAEQIQVIDDNLTYKQDKNDVIVNNFNDVCVNDKIVDLNVEGEKLQPENYDQLHHDNKEDVVVAPLEKPVVELQESEQALEDAKDSLQNLTMQEHDEVDEKVEISPKQPENVETVDIVETKAEGVVEDPKQVEPTTISEAEIRKSNDIVVDEVQKPDNAVMNEQQASPIIEQNLQETQPELVQEEIKDAPVDYSQYPENYYQNEYGAQQYDENGQPLQYDPNNLQYDEQGNLLQYDANGQLIQYDVNGQMIGQYDENGQLIQYNENGEIMQYEGQDQVQYDENGQVIQYQNENGQVMQYQDENGQMIQYQDENGQVIQYQNENGPMMQYQDENGQVMQYQDENGQMVAYNQQQVEGYETQNQVYDESGQVYNQENLQNVANQPQQPQPDASDVESKQETVTFDSAKEENKKPHVLELLETDSESQQRNEDTSKTNDSDFEFSSNAA